MTREQKVAKAKALKAAGLTHQEIGEHFGVTASAVTKWLNPDAAKLWNQRDQARPERKAAKRQWDNEHDRKPCPACGRPRAVGVHRREPNGLCRSCRNDQIHGQHLARCHRIERLWNLGRTMREIAEDMDSTINSIAVEIVHMRRAGGWDLPYRYNVDNGRRIAA